MENQEIDNKQTENQDTSSSPKKWFKRLGWGAIAFFTIKGIVWLLIFFGLFKWLGCE